MQIKQVQKCAIRFQYLLAALVSFVVLTTAAAQPIPTELYSGLKWRLIGPFRGGRVVAVAGFPGSSTTFYFGSVDGGVWQTTDAGMVWKPIFDGQAIASIGALAVAPSDPKVIYAGTGESDIRSNLSSGDGVYKSSRWWTELDQRRTARFAPDQQDHCRSAKCKLRLRRRFRTRLCAEQRARRLQIDGWRLDLDKSSGSGSGHWGFGSGHCHRGLKASFRHYMAKSPSAMEHLRAARRSGQRSLPLPGQRPIVVASHWKWIARRRLGPHRRCCFAERQARVRAYQRFQETWTLSIRRRRKYLDTAKRRPPAHQPRLVFRKHHGRSK